MDAKYRPHTNLFTIASDIKYFLLSGYQALPFVIGGTFTVLGLYTAQFSMLFFLIGYLILTPLLTLIPTLAVNMTNATSKSDPWLVSPGSDICNMLSIDSEEGNEPVRTVITPWLAMVAFFLGYMAQNARSILQKPIEYPPKADQATKKATDNKAMLRRSQATIGLIAIIVLSIVILVMRTYVSGCDSFMGGVLSFVFAYIGSCWYALLSVNNNDRLSDIFGIANRLIVPSALLDAPYACLASD